MIKIILLFILNILFIFNLVSQEKYSTNSRRALKKYHEAVKYFNVIDKYKALELAEKAIKIDENFVEAYLLIANIHHANKEYELVIDAYLSSIEINPDLYPSSYKFLAEAYVKLRQYDEAFENLEIYLSYEIKNEINKFRAKKELIRCKFASKAIKNPVLFDPQNLGENVNTKYDDYWPSITADEKTLVTTVRIPNNDSRNINSTQEDFFVSFKINEIWTPTTNVGKPLNTFDNEGAQSISSDGKLMYFTACNRPDGKGSCDIYFSERVSNRWQKPVNIGYPINTPSFESQPTISSDGKTLYFSSNRIGGMGEADIWKSELKKNGKWGNPINLGDSINTEKKEMSPFIHPDNETLYFSSEGLVGMGGFDLFIARKNKKNKFEKVKNLGYPINTEENEMGIVVNAKGDLAYFGSDRSNGMGKDIYSFKLYEEIKPNEITYMKGIVFDADTKLPLKAKFELINLETEEIIIESETDKNNGDFLVCLPTNKYYALNVSKNGYLFYSESFSPKKGYLTYKKNIPLSPIEIGRSVILKNIFFETDSYKLKKISIPELKKLTNFLKLNPDININIYGHTDNVGSDEHNRILSQNRAKAVYDYLISNYIESYRLDYDGFGAEKPIATNETEEGRALNRRTVFETVE